jgi:hypothetical protein
MKWNKSSNLDKAFEDSLNTFIDLLESSDKTPDETEDIISHFRELISNEEYLEDNISLKELSEYKRLHDFTHDNISLENLAQGCIVVLVNGKNKTILDGTHRINTLVKTNPELKAYTIIFELSF